MIVHIDVGSSIIMHQLSTEVSYILKINIKHNFLICVILSKQNIAHYDEF